MIVTAYRLAPKSYTSEAQYLVRVSFMKHQIRSYTLRYFYIIIHLYIVYRSLQKTNASGAPIELNIDQTTAAAAAAAAVGGNFLAKLDLFPTSTSTSTSITRRQYYTHECTPMHSYTSHVHTIQIYFILYTVPPVVYVQCTRTNCGGHERERTRTDAERDREREKVKKTNPLDKFCVLHDTPCNDSCWGKNNTYHTM